MYKTYIDNTVYWRKQEYYAQGWIFSEMERPESVADIYDEEVSVSVPQDGTYYAVGTAFDMESFFKALLYHIDYTNRVEQLGEEGVDEFGDITYTWTDSTPYNNGADLEDDTHG